jgi:hypothetical protein
VYLSVVRRRWLVTLMVAVFGLAWALRLSGAIGNWPMTIVILADLALFPVPAYIADYRARIAQPAFGLPERRSKETRHATAALAGSDDETRGNPDLLATRSGAGGRIGT